MTKILIVEDEQAYSGLLDDQLTKAGYNVTIADNGEKGLVVAKMEKPNLILLDIRLPKMDGMTMFDLLRNEPECKSIKVIFLTNLEADDKIIQKVTKNPPSYYFVKSNTKLNDLIDKIKEVTAN